LQLSFNLAGTSGSHAFRLLREPADEVTGEKLKVNVPLNAIRRRVGMADWRSRREGECRYGFFGGFELCGHLFEAV
jgi:hypothetical protein